MDEVILQNIVQVCPKGHVHVTLDLRGGVLSANTYDYELTAEEAIEWANAFYAAVRAITGGN